MKDTQAITEVPSAPIFTAEDIKPVSNERPIISHNKTPMQDWSNIAQLYGDEHMAMHVDYSGLS